MDIDVGIIDRIKIWHDNSGIGASWLLDSVIIRKMHSTCRPITDVFVQRLEKISEILYRQASKQLKRDHTLRNPSTKENEQHSVDRPISSFKEYDDIASNRSILRSPIVYDKTNLQKKVTWDEQSIGSQDEPFSIDTQGMKNMQKAVEQKRKGYSSSPQIETGHFNYQAYWISSHKYTDNKWQINSIEEENTLDIDKATCSLLLSDRLATSSKTKTSIHEKDDDIYEFEANLWLGSGKGENNCQVHLTPKSSKLSTNTNDEAKSKSLSSSKTYSDNRDDKHDYHDSKRLSRYGLSSPKKSSDSRYGEYKDQDSNRLSQHRLPPSKASFNTRYDEHDDQDSKRSSRSDHGSLERSPRSLTPSDRLLSNAPKIQLDSRLSPRSNQRISSIYKQSEEDITDKHHRLLSPTQHPKSSYDKMRPNISSLDERDLSARFSNESRLSNQYSKLPSYNKEPTSPLNSSRKSFEQMSTESLSRSKPEARSDYERFSQKTTGSMSDYFYI